MGCGRVSSYFHHTRTTRRATKYMNAEDALLTREKRERQEDTRQDKGQKMARTGDARRTIATPLVEHQAPTEVLPVKRMALKSSTPLFLVYLSEF